MPAATLTRFVEDLGQSTVLSAEQRTQLPELQERYPDAHALAHEMLRRGWMTPYQINHIAQGRWRDLQVGPYVLVERLGEGGMGQVFKARQSSLGRIVALKVIRPECLANPRVIRRFLREIRAASQLSHPNIVHAYDADQVGGAYYIAMEYVEGIDLSKLVKRSGPLSVSLACDLVRQAALGLQHAFERGLIHRDIKPGNLLLQSIVRGPSSVVKNSGSRPSLPASSLTTDHGPRTTDHVLKITDFGLARWNDDDPDRPMSHLTQVGSVLGTPEFISPEQTRNSSACDIRSDLYSLGCTFYFLLAGQPPFASGTLTEKLMAHQVDKAEPVGKVRRAKLWAGLNGQALSHVEETQLQVPAAVEQVIVKLLAKHPSERYQTPGELAAALADIGGRLARGLLPVPPQPQPETLFGADLEIRLGPGTPSPDGRRVKLIPPPANAGGSPVVAGGLALVAEGAATVLISSPVVAAGSPAVANGSAGVQAGRDRSAMTTQVVTSPTPSATPAPLEPLVFHAPMSPARASRRVWPWLLLPAVIVPPLLAAMMVAFLLVARPSRGGTTPAAAEATESADEVQWKKLAQRSPKKSAPVAIRQDLLQFRTRFPGSPHVAEADSWLARLPSPFDALDTVSVPKVPFLGVQAPPELVAILGKHAGYSRNPASIVAASPDGRWLLGAEGAELRLWDTAELSKPPARFQPHGPRLHAAVFSPDGKRLATAGAGDDAGDDSVRMWDPASRKRLLTFDKHQAAVTRLAFRRDGTRIASAGGDGFIRVWDPATGAESGSLASGPDPVQAIAFSPDGQTLFWGAGNHVRWVRVQEGSMVASKSAALDTPGAARILSFAPDGKTFLCGGSQGTVLVCTWDGRSLANRTTLDHAVTLGKNKFALAVNQAVFSPDGKWIATGSTDHRVRVWDAQSLTLLKQWDLRCNVLSATFTLDSRHLVTGNGNSTLTVFRVASLVTP